MKGRCCCCYEVHSVEPVRSDQQTPGSHDDEPPEWGWVVPFHFFPETDHKCYGSDSCPVELIPE